jgi:GxxExxY protein
MPCKDAKPPEDYEMTKLTAKIIGAALEVHQALGPGLLESAYEECLAHEMHLRGLGFLRQVSLPVVYKGIDLDCAYRLDFLVEDFVVLELKAVDSLLPIHTAQVLTYLKLGGWSLGLLLNFNVPILKEGIRRLIFNHHNSSASSASLR